MTMIVSPRCTRRAAAPLTFISPEPRSPAMVYVSKRAPLSTSTTCTCSCSRMLAASRMEGVADVEDAQPRVDERAGDDLGVDLAWDRAVVRGVTLREALRAGVVL